MQIVKAWEFNSKEHCVYLYTVSTRGWKEDRKGVIKSDKQRERFKRFFNSVTWTKVNMIRSWHPQSSCSKFRYLQASSCVPAASLCCVCVLYCGHVHSSVSVCVCLCTVAWLSAVLRIWNRSASICTAAIVRPPILWPPHNLPSDRCCWVETYDCGTFVFYMSMCQRRTELLFSSEFAKKKKKSRLDFYKDQSFKQTSVTASSTETTWHSSTTAPSFSSVSAK